MQDVFEHHIIKYNPMLGMGVNKIAHDKCYHMMYEEEYKSYIDKNFSTMEELFPSRVIIDKFMEYHPKNKPDATFYSDKYGFWINVRQNRLLVY